uniref:Uncharacterized protein n=1 Tax=Cacopsylla melanoneura TaxID=428564 RepID=A0A8D8QPN9_9HEMI
MFYKCVFRKRRELFIPVDAGFYWSAIFIVTINCVFGSKADILQLQSVDLALDKMFHKMKKLQTDKKFLNHKMERVFYGANDVDDQLAMLKIELSNYPNIPHEHIFRITKNFARDWGIFNERDITDMYVFSKDTSLRQDKNVIIAFKSMSRKYKWLNRYKEEALRTGLKSLKGFKGIPIIFHPDKEGPYIRFHIRMLDHVSRYKAFLLSVCWGKARTLNKYNSYRFWVNQSQIYGVCQQNENNERGMIGLEPKHFKINCFDDISREIT